MFTAGNYYGKPTKYGFAEPDGKQPYVFIEFDITHVANGGDWMEVPTEKRTVYLYVSDASWPYTKDKLTKLGFNGDFGPDLDFSDTTKAGVELTCKVETYEGKQRDKWDIAFGGQGHAVANANTARKFNAKWKAEVGAKPAGKPPAPAKPPVIREPGQDDDLPI